MSSINSNTLPALIYTVDGNYNFLHNLIRTKNENIDFEPNITRNFSLDSLEKDKEPIEKINSSNSLDFISSIIDHNPMPSLDEIIHIIPINSNDQNDSFFIMELENLLTNPGSKSILVEKEGLLGKKRLKRQRARKEEKDDIRVKIKRAFFNTFLKNKLNRELKSIGSKKYFEKFPNHFASDPHKKRNKGIVYMTLGEIFEKKELYINENEKGLFNFWQNLKIVQSEEIKKNEKFQKILNKTFRELYEEYLNSDEFKIIEKNRLEEKNLDDDYIKRYIELSENLIEFFSE